MTHASTRMHCSVGREDVQRLIQIRDRAVRLADSLGHDRYGKDAGGFFLDLLNVHELVGLQLTELLAAEDGDFAHDTFGIYRFFDRETRTLQDGFCPRFAAPKALALEGSLT